MSTNQTKRLHLDRRAATLARGAPEGNQDALLEPKELCAWLGVSVAWLYQSRRDGFGLPYLKLGTSTLRYRRSDVLKWLAQREQVARPKQPTIRRIAAEHKR